MLKDRIQSGVILIALALLFVILGGNVLFTAVLAISFVGLMEFYRMLNVNKTPLASLGFIATVGYYALLFFGKEEHTIVFFIGAFFCIMIMYVLTFPKYTSEQALMVFFGIFYVSMLLSYIYRVRMCEDGTILVGLIFFGAWGSDTCAYCVGKLIGKHKLTPKLSPKKTIEGCIGGIVGAALLGLLYGTIFKSQISGVANPQFAYAITCGVAAALSQFGDLTASAFKRHYNIKDYGKLIPGHGGILDRFDSIIFTAPLVFYLTQWL